MLAHLLVTRVCGIPALDGTKPTSPERRPLRGIAVEIEHQHAERETGRDGDEVERSKLAPSEGQTDDNNTHGGAHKQSRPLIQSRVREFLVHVREGDDAHAEQCETEAAAVEPAHGGGDGCDGALFVVGAEVVFVGGGDVVVGEDELGEGRGGEDVGHDEGKVHGCPAGGGDPVAPDGVHVDAVGVDFEVDPREGGE